MSSSAFEVDTREERLPKWAREQMARLRRAAVEAEGRANAARLATKPEESDTLIDPYDDYPIGLGKGTSIRFLTGNGAGYVDVLRMAGGGVQVMASGRLSVTPIAANHLELAVP